MALSFGTFNLMQRRDPARPDRGPRGDDRIAAVVGTERR